MALVHFWPLCALLFLPVVRGLQDGRPLPIPRILRVYADEGDIDDFGVWNMNIEWKDGFTDSSKADKVSYDLQIFHSEQNRLVHNETVEAKADLMGTYHWRWTSPIPLQCTTHSVRMRSRIHNYTSDWTASYSLLGNDTGPIDRSKVYPQNHNFLVGDPVVFCCILAPDSIKLASSEFKIQISNRTYITEPLRQQSPTPAAGLDIKCVSNSGSTYHTGYKPDVRDFTCETRNLSVVECYWELGRETGESEEIKHVNYSINGRNCSLNPCVLNEDINKGERNWTLIAKNVLGMKIISDQADPKHRVRLKAPVLDHATLIYARKATLEWNWNGILNYDSFPVICQVEVNGHIVKETFSGTGLKSLVLENLQPFTAYTARVRCGSYEHFYKWGDWSEPITFTTAEDIPEALDAWMQVFNGETFVLWKVPTKNQSHGTITGYKLDVRNSRNPIKKHINIFRNETCHRLPNPGIAESDQVISVSANNSAGLSPPSVIIVPNKPSDLHVKTAFINGQNGSFDIVWEPSPRSSCGYVVDWFPTYNAQQCDLKWKKFPPAVSNAKINSDFKEGVRYTLSVYACTEKGPELLQRSEGYVKDLKPSVCFHNLKAEVSKSGVDLSWEDLPKEKQTGFIKEYVVSYKAFSGNKDSDKDSFIEACRWLKRECSIKLPPAIYTFQVVAFTSAGGGSPCQTTISVELHSQVIIISVVLALAVSVCVLSFVTVLCYRKREWLKLRLYPDIPKPKLTDAGFTMGVLQCRLIDKVLLAESEMLMVKNLEPCPEILPKLPKGESDALVMFEPLDPVEPGYCQNYGPELSSSISMDSSYTQIPCSGIANPTYNRSLSFPVEADLVSAYIPQKQNRDQLQPYDIKPVTVVCSYKPQVVANLSHQERSNNNSLTVNSPLHMSSEYLFYQT